MVTLNSFVPPLMLVEIAKDPEPSNVSALPVVSALELEANTTPFAVKEVRPVPPFVVARVPVTPVLRGSPVALVRVTDDGVPRAGVTRVGLVAKTKAPEPVSSVTAAARLADDGVPRNVATFVPKPLTPVAMGKPVALVRVTDDGVPRAGVTRVGLFDSTTFVVPVLVVTPVPPFATGNVPVTPVVKGKPVKFVATPLEGVPRAGVTRVGEVENTKFVDVVPVAPAAVKPVMLLNEAMLAVVAFVPPLATGSAAPRVRAAKWFSATMMSVPLLTRAIFAAAGIETPVWPATLNVIADAVLLKTKYIFVLVVGTVTMPPPVPLSWI